MCFLFVSHICFVFTLALLVSNKFELDLYLLLINLNKIQSKFYGAIALYHNTKLHYHTYK